MRIFSHFLLPPVRHFMRFSNKIKKQIKYNELAKEVRKLSRGSLQADAPQARQPPSEST